MHVISLLVGSPQQKITSNKSHSLISESNSEYSIGEVLSRVSAFRGYLMVWMGDAARGSSSFVRLSSLFCWFSPFVPSEVRFAANSYKAALCDAVILYPCSYFEELFVIKQCSSPVGLFAVTSPISGVYQLCEQDVKMSPLNVLWLTAKFSSSRSLTVHFVFFLLMSIFFGTYL